MTTLQQIIQRNDIPPTSLIRRHLRSGFMPQRLVKFRVRTKYNGRTTVWLTDKGYQIKDTANGWFDYMSDKYIALLREQKQIA